MKKILITLLFGMLLLASCSNEELMHNSGKVEEGKPALVSLKMDMATMGSGKTRSMTPEQENKIENIRVMIFNNKGEIVTNRKYTGDPGASLNIETFSGNNCNICIVANAADALDSRLALVYTSRELEDATVTALELNFGLDDSNPLLMTGSAEDVNIQAGKSTLTEALKLNFLAAKVTLVVKDNTPSDQQVTLLGWDVIDVPTSSYVFPAANDINPDPDTDNDNKYWLTTAEDNPFDENDVASRTATQELYLLENRRGGRVSRSLPGDPAHQYPGMAVDDANDKGKAWYKPKRATAILINAMHKTPTETKQVAAYIYLGSDNHSNYDIVRSNHYTFTVTVNGLNDIDVDTNVEYTVGDFKVDHGDHLNMDSHPDYRPMRIHASGGVATMEIVDAAGRTYGEPGFDATWLKISPLDLMFHQVKQDSPNDEWQQQAGVPGSFVRAKYIPHKSVRTALASKGGWNAIPLGKEDDDVMAFSDATYRMCYKITDIPFPEATAVTNKTLCVYADEFHQDGGNRSATIRISFYKDGGDPSNPEVKNYTVSQSGYLSFFDENDPDAGLAVLNEDGTPSDVKKKFVFETIEEAELAINPGIDPSVQRSSLMQWGFPGVLLYTKPDRVRNGKFLTANAVYNDVDRVDNEPANFGKTSTSYREMYDIGAYFGGGHDDPIPNYTKLTVAPYYYPNATDWIYHPIYRSSAARYCHEKNRDMNGDGIIDASEAHWYMPTVHELLMVWITGSHSFIHDNPIGGYMCSTEFMYYDTYAVSYFTLNVTHYDYFYGAYAYRTDPLNIRCIREL